MKFYCVHCKKIIERDMRYNSSKAFITNKGHYKSLCTSTSKDSLMIPVKDNKFSWSNLIAALTHNT